MLGKQSAFCRVCADFRRFAPETLAGLLFNASAIPPCNASAPKPQNHKLKLHSSGSLCTYCGYNKFNSATLERLLQLYGARLAPISADPSDWLGGQGVDIDRKDAQVRFSSQSHFEVSHKAMAPHITVETECLEAQTPVVQMILPFAVSHRVSCLKKNLFYLLLFYFILIFKIIVLKYNKIKSNKINDAFLLAGQHCGHAGCQAG